MEVPRGIFTVPSLDNPVIKVWFTETSVVV